MSDMEVAVSAPPSTPTAEIAATVIESAESTPSSTPEVSAAAPPEPAAAAEPELSPAAKFLVSKGHKWGKRADGKTDLTYLPASTAANFLDDYLAQHRATWDGERTTLDHQRKEYETALNEYRTLIAGDPKAFLEQLSGFDPRYKSFLTPAPAPEPQSFTLPEPDVDFNGARTWSMETFQKSIIPSIIAQAKAEAKAEAEGVLKPFREKDERAEWERGQQERVRQRTSELESLPLFGPLAKDGPLTEFQQKVLGVLQADTARSKEARAKGQPYTLMTHKEAYWEVAGPHMAGRLSEDDTAKRERLAKEASDAARATPTVARTGAEVARVPAGVDTRSIASRIIEQHGG